jgi:HK97 gp10 family phage protein
MAIEIEGLAELSEIFTQIAPRTAKRYLGKAGDAAAQVVINAADETVPVEVGILEESLISEKSWENDGESSTMTIEIGPKKGVFWGSLQEFGTSTQPAQHWLTRAWEASKDKCLNVFATEMVGLLQDLENKK